MLDKHTCQRCHQKHEMPWEEEVWEEGYVTCPSHLITIYHKGVKAHGPAVRVVQAVYALRRVEEEPPCWCE